MPTESAAPAAPDGASRGRPTAVSTALQLQRSIGNRATARVLQRVVRATAPRSGATAAARIPEFVERLNAVSSSVWWDLDGDRLQYWEFVGIARSDFDQRMIDYVDRAEVVPLR